MGGNIMKVKITGLLLLLITIVGVVFGITEVKAESYQGTIHEGAWIPGYWISKKNGSTISYHQARWLNNSEGEAIYCLYESGPLYNYGFSQHSGEGIRYWLMARGEIGKRMVITAKFGTTDYFDRSVIGSSYQQIDGSSQSDVDLQVRWKF